MHELRKLCDGAALLSIANQDALDLAAAFAEDPPEGLVSGEDAGSTQENGKLRPSQDGFGHASHEPLRHACSDRRAHGDQVDVEFQGHLENGVRRISCADEIEPSHIGEPFSKPAKI